MGEAYVHQLTATADMMIISFVLTIIASCAILEALLPNILGITIGFTASFCHAIGVGP